jgi:outer membrane protein OmpA-like peptidoglycan-associated protein
VPGRHLILQSSVPALQKLLKTLKDNPKLKVEIQGHVCCTNNGEDGVDYDTREPKLSENRAKAIYEYLIDKGITKARLSYKGYGRSKPKEPVEDSPAKEQANRRVEILILEK